MPMRYLNILAIALLLFVFSSYRETPKDEALMQAIIENLNAAHYQPQKIDDEFSHKVFDLYLKRLDYSKKFLTQADVNQLKKYRDLLDDEVNAKNYEFFTVSSDLINKRIDQAQGYYKEILSKPFDFSTDETIETDADKQGFAADEAALKETWRKYLKYQVLTRVSDRMDEMDKQKESGKTEEKPKGLTELESESRTKVLQSMDEYFKRLKGISEDDRVASYLNVMANTYDPHTEYFPPRQKEDFDIAMSGQLEGIGAQLQEKDGQIKVTNIVPGSASWRDGHLKEGDVIMKVAQGKNEPVDVVGMKLDDAVRLIRGKKGTEVRLTVKKPDGSMVVIPIVRDVVVLEETFAQSVLVGDKKDIGYIRLPSFYADFNNRNGRRCAEDVRKELEKLKNNKVNGVILDLRNNGGGSLMDVIQMAGLFIEKGPIVQVKSRTGSPEVDEDRDPSIVYDGPLVILVNENSASASEIMAAAIQDYHRGVIIGNTTFGKGTVQRFLDLDDYVSADNSKSGPLGSIKLTTQKFYRINGDATQLKGVVPDINLPDVFQYVDEYEKDQDYPMPFDRIAPAEYKEWKGVKLDKIIKNSHKRIDKDPSFLEIAAEADRLKTKKSHTVENLNLDKFRTERKQENADYKKYEDISKTAPTIQIANLPEDVKEMGKDTAVVARKTNWQKNIKKDVYLYEAMQVIGDMR